jgi:hypothetical protein
MVLNGRLISTTSKTTSYVLKFSTAPKVKGREMWP